MLSSDFYLTNPTHLRKFDSDLIIFHLLHSLVLLQKELPSRLTIIKGLTQGIFCHYKTVLKGAIKTAVLTALFFGYNLVQDDSVVARFNGTFHDLERVGQQT